MNQSERIAVESLDRIRELERERKEDRAAIREADSEASCACHLLRAHGGEKCPVCKWREKHAATIARATSQEGAKK